MKTYLAPALVLSLLMLCGAPAAVHADDNQLGLFYDPATLAHEVDVSPNSMHALYLVLLNPVNDSFDGGGSRDVDFVAGFECAVEAPSGDILLDLSFPSQAINVGTVANIRAGFAPAVPVSNQRAATLATLNVLTLGNSPVGYRLVPFSPSSLPSAMAYMDSDDPSDSLVEMVPVSGSFDEPVFTFGDYTIEENARWGEVKVLFR
jgi:hypothetical protein